MELAETQLQRRDVVTLSARTAPTAEPSRPPLAMSIDVEEWFHVENMRRAVPMHAWERQEVRVERVMDRMLELMALADVHATCFVLGWVATRMPSLVRRIATAGHEIACHGYGHELVSQMEPRAFRADVERAKNLLEDVTGRPVRGYRAPNFSVTEWALPILRDLGFEYDSSLCPTTLPYRRYSKPKTLMTDPAVVTRRDSLIEVTVSCLPVGRHALPWGGGAYFRLIPYALFKQGIEKILAGGRPYVFYIHPWELDPAQPRVRGLRPSERARHYLNLEKTEPRWAQLLRDFDWITIGELVDSYPHTAQVG